jgi:hypothetical protein
MAGISQISVTFNNLYHTSTKEVVQHRFAGLSTLSLIIFSVLVVSTYGLTEGFINDIQFLIMGGTKETILLSSDPIRQNIFLFIFCFQTLSPIFLLPVTYVDDASGLSRKKVWVSLVSLIAMIILFYCFLDPFKNIDLDSGIFMLSVIVILLVQVFNYIIGIQYIFKYVFKTSAKTHYKKVLFCLIPMIISAIGAVTIVYLVDRFFPVFSGSEIIAFFIKGLTIFSLSVAVHILILRKTAEFAFVKNTIQGIFKRFFKRKSKAKKTNPN